MLTTSTTFDLRQPPVETLLHTSYIPGLPVWWKYQVLFISLVPMLPPSRMQTLKLCRCGELAHVTSVKGYIESGQRDLNCAWVYPKTQNRQEQGSGQLTTCLWLSGYEYHTH